VISKLWICFVTGCVSARRERRYLRRGQDSSQIIPVIHWAVTAFSKHKERHSCRVRGQSMFSRTHSLRYNSILYENLKRWSMHYEKTRYIAEITTSALTNSKKKLIDSLFIRHLFNYNARILYNRKSKTTTKTIKLQVNLRSVPSSKLKLPTRSRKYYYCCRHKSYQR
jgi:hypothetical protein